MNVVEVGHFIEAKDTAIEAHNENLALLVECRANDLQEKNMNG